MTTSATFKGQIVGCLRKKPSEPQNYEETTNRRELRCIVGENSRKIQVST